ncbi:MAG: polysaccharide export [Prolixibacteraceae bacterium]|nr:MAG: polysaccharide export [Prolixibacteraceae bacterium]
MKTEMYSFTWEYQQNSNRFKMKGYKRIASHATMILIIMLFFSSCVSQRNLEYLRNKDKNDKTIISYVEAKIPDYKLKIKDELSINIRSLDDPATNVFQTLGNQQGSFGGYATPYSASLTSYMIDKSGFIQLPVIGNMYVEDKTIPEVISMLQDSLNNILSSPTVTIKLVNRYISVLGEVVRPGNFSYAQEKLNVFDAIGMAGDLTIYGDRNDVILIRNENGNNLRINIDLTSSDIMASEYYYLRPNDMIYVKPMNKRFWGLAQLPWAILFSTISTAVLLYSVFGK